MNPIFLDLGFIQIYWYSITMLLAIVVGSFIFYKGLRKKGFSEEEIANLLFGMIIWGIIGARIYYVLFNLNYYLKYPIEILEIWNGGLAIHGAVLGGIIYIYFYTKKQKKDFFSITDSAALGILLSQAVGRWGNFFNGEAHGGITTLEHLRASLIPNFIIKGMYINGNYYLPTFYYEFWWNIIGFIIIYIIYKKYKYLKTGQLTGLYFMWYSIGRFVIEGMRTDSLMLGTIRIAKLISILLFLIGGLLVFYKRKDSRMNRLKKKEIYHES